MTDTFKKYSFLLFISWMAMLVSSCSNDSSGITGRSLEASNEILFGNGRSGESVISRNGKYVAFESYASNLVPDDTNDSADIFVKDLDSGELQRLSISAENEQGNGNSYHSSISADGTYIAFSSDASNLVPGDTNRQADIFVKDLRTGNISLVSENEAGIQGDGFSEFSSISADGRYVAFQSNSSNLVPGHSEKFTDTYIKDLQTGGLKSIFKGAKKIDSDTLWPAIAADGSSVAFTSSSPSLVFGDINQEPDVLLMDNQTEAIKTISASASGTSGNKASGILGFTSVSDDGRFIAFSSLSTNLIAGDLHAEMNVFVKDRQTNGIRLLSSSPDGAAGNDISAITSISADGRFVAFQSEATNLVSDDNNGALDVFMVDTLKGEISRVSLDSAGNEALGNSAKPSVSNTGNLIAFESDAENLIAGVANGDYQIYVKDVTTGRLTLVSGKLEGVST